MTESRPSTAQVANQQLIDASSARLARDSYCFVHKHPKHWLKYVGWHCGECEWDRYLAHERDTEPYPDVEPEETAI